MYKLITRKNRPVVAVLHRDVCNRTQTSEVWDTTGDTAMNGPILSAVFTGGASMLRDDPSVKLDMYFAIFHNVILMNAFNTIVS